MSKRKTRKKKQPEFGADLVPVTSGLDQPLASTEITNRIMSAVDVIVTRMDADQHPHVGMEAVKHLMAVRRISGIALAKLLYFLSRRWKAYGMEDEFKDRAYSDLSVGPTTTDRYVLVWDMFENGKVPEDAREKLLRRPMKDLILLAYCWKHMDRRLLVGDWRKFSNATDSSTLSTAVNDKLGRESRSNKINIDLDEEGLIKVFGADGEVETIGMLYLELATTSDLAEAGMNRVIAGGGIRVTFGDEVTE